MATQIQWRRGTTAEHAPFTGAVGELTVDTTKDTVVVHDGVTAGGHPLAKETSVQSVETQIVAASTKAVPVDADIVGIVDTANSNVLKKLTWTNIKAFLKTYFDTLYQAAGSYLTAASIGSTVQGYDADTTKNDVANTFTLPQYGTKATDNDLSFDIGAGGKLFFDCTLSAGGTLTFTNIPASPCWVTIKLVNASNYAVAAHANTKVTSTFLATISATGTYIIAGYCDGTNVHCATAGASA